MKATEWVCVNKAILSFPNVILLIWEMVNKIYLHIIHISDTHD